MSKLSNQHGAERVQTIVIGGGQAGLAVGYYLAKRNLSFLILDANAHIGDAWRNRWDSLRLFTPARHAALDGMRFPAPGSSFTTKDQVADYLAAYAERFQLPVRNEVKVERLWKEGGRFVMVAGNERFESDNVVIAMSNYQVPRIPPFARHLSGGIVQIHSHHYKNPSQLQPGGVLVVGVGNSGADISLEVVHTHITWLSGKESGYLPLPIDTFFGRNVLLRAVRFVGHNMFTVDTRMGKRLRRKLQHKGAPLVRVKPRDLVAAGIERVPRTAGVMNGLPLLEDGRVLNVTNVIWCTGYQHGFPWIYLPIFEENGGDPIHENGVVPHVPGLYFVGLHFLYAMSSATLIGVSRDAKRIAEAINRRVRSGMSEVPQLHTSEDAKQPADLREPELSLTGD